ncbi:transporter, partial [Streptomyces sp. FT05W]
MRVGDEREHGQVTSIVPTESAKMTPKGRTPGASAAVRHGRPARTAP